MATIKAVLNTKYQGKDGAYPIAIRVIDGEQQRHFAIGYRIPERFWDDGQVSDKHPESDIINAVIDEERLRAKRYYADCKIKNIPPDIDLVFKEVKSHSFTGYLRHRAKQHKDAEQIEMHFKVERYLKELNYCFGRELYFNEVTQDLLRKLETWLMKADASINKTPNSANTRNKKFEFLSKYYNNAIDEGKAQAPNPFKKYKIKTTPVKKEKLTAEEIGRIESLDLDRGPVRLARDLFLFSYYCKGLRFENCISMPKSAINGERLVYKINKGNRHASAVIHPKLQAIISYWIDNNTDTIFGRFHTNDLSTAAGKRKTIGSENAYINAQLKTVGGLADLRISLTMHLARHSFAYNLKKISNNIHVIKDALGHSRTQTTETYLKELDSDYVDDQVKALYL